jgi:hypothetical protein
VRSAADLWRRRRRFAWCWLVALGAGAATLAVANAAARHVPRAQPLAELSYYPSGTHLKPATLGHAETAADLAWLRAVQYYGEHRATDNRFDHMAHVFDILTSLSPRYEAAYVFGAFALAQEGRNFAAAERLMQLGLERNPRSGTLAFEAGFLYYVRPGGRDLSRAAEYFEQASRQPDAPPQAARFAAFARQAAGELEVAFALWADVYRHSPNPYLRQIAEEKMKEIRDAVEQGEREKARLRLTTPVVRIGGS